MCVINFVSNNRQINSLFRLTMNETVKLRITNLLWWESNGNRWDSAHKGPIMRETHKETVMWEASPCPGIMTKVTITVKSWWARWRLQSPASQLFTQPLIQVQIKENIKAPCQWPLCREFTGEFPHKGPVTWKMFPFDDVIIFLPASELQLSPKWHGNAIRIANPFWMNPT